MTKQQRCSRELTRVPVCSLGVCPCAGVASGRHLISPICQHLRPGAPSDRPATLREPFSTTQLPWRTCARACACACACARARDCAGACSHETWQVVRRSLKSEMQAKAKMRDVSHMKVIEYEGGKSAKIRTRPSLASPLIFSPRAPPVLSFVVLYICKHPISCQPLKHARLWPGCRHDGPSGGVGVSRVFTGEWFLEEQEEIRVPVSLLPWTSIYTAVDPKRNAVVINQHGVMNQKSTSHSSVQHAA